MATMKGKLSKSPTWSCTCRSARMMVGTIAISCLTAIDTTSNSPVASSEPLGGSRADKSCCECLCFRILYRGRGPDHAKSHVASGLNCRVLQRHAHSAAGVMLISPCLQAQDPKICLPWTRDPNLTLCNQQQCSHDQETGLSLPMAWQGSSCNQWHACPSLQLRHELISPPISTGQLV